jgi:CBS domain-containing protein
LGLGLRVARALGRLEFLEGLVVGAAEGVLVAVELDERVVFAVSIERDTEESGVLVVDDFPARTVPLRSGVAALFGLAGAFHTVNEDAGLDAGNGAEAPIEASELAEAGLLEGVGGLEDVAEAVEEGLEFGGGLHGEDGVAGAEAVGFGWHRETSLGRPESQCAPIRG